MFASYTHTDEEEAEGEWDDGKSEFFSAVILPSSPSRHHYQEVRLIFLSEPFISFQDLAATLSSSATSGDPGEALNARLYVFAVQLRPSASSLLPDSTVSHGGHKSKLL